MKKIGVNSEVRMSKVLLYLKLGALGSHTSHNRYKTIFNI